MLEHDRAPLSTPDECVLAHVCARARGHARELALDALIFIEFQRDNSGNGCDWPTCHPKKSFKRNTHLSHESTLNVSERGHATTLKLSIVDVFEIKENISRQSQEEEARISHPDFFQFAFSLEFKRQTLYTDQIVWMGSADVLHFHVKSSVGF